VQYQTQFFTLQPSNSLISGDRALDLYGPPVALQGFIDTARVEFGNGCKRLNNYDPVEPNGGWFGRKIVNAP
jgi:hypothetical protein